MEVCNCCGLRTEDFAKFKCPSCSTELARCFHCRRVGKKYKCPKCGFMGP